MAANPFLSPPFPNSLLANPFIKQIHGKEGGKDKNIAKLSGTSQLASSFPAGSLPRGSEARSSVVYVTSGVSVSLPLPARGFCDCHRNSSLPHPLPPPPPLSGFPRLFRRRGAFGRWGRGANLFLLLLLLLGLFSCVCGSLLGKGETVA